MTFWTWAIWASLGTLTISFFVPSRYTVIIILILLLGAMLYIDKSKPGGGGLNDFFSQLTGGKFTGTN